MPATRTLDVLVISEVSPTGDKLLTSIERTIGDAFNCIPVRSRQEFDEALQQLDQFHAALVGHDLGWASGLEILPELTATNVPLRIIMVTESNGMDLVAEGFALGLDDFIRGTQLDRLHAALNGFNPPAALSVANPSQVSHIPDLGGQTQALSAIVSDYVFSYYVYADGTLVNEWRSDGLQQITGYTSNEINEHGWEQLVLPEDHDTIWQRTKRVISGESTEIEYRVRTKSGETRWIHEFTRAIWDDAEQRFTRFVGSARDVTETRVASYLKSGQVHVLELIAIGADLTTICDEIMSLLLVHPTDHACMIHRYSEHERVLNLVGERNLSDTYFHFWEHLSIDDHDTGQTAAVASQQLIVVPDTDQEDRWTDEMRQLRSSSWSSQIIIPIIGTSHNVLGTLSVLRSEPGEPEKPYLERMTIASRLLGVAIEKIESERQLARTQLRYQRLAEEIPAVTFIASADTSMQLRYLSPQAAAIIDESMLDTYNEFPFITLVHPADRRAVAASFQRMSEPTAAVLVEFRLDHRFGESKWLQCSAALIDDHPDDEPCWQGILLDVTSRRNAELALRESQTQFRALFDNNPHIAFTLDTRGRFQRINPASTRITGYTEDELVGRPFTSVLVAGEQERVWQHFRDTLSGESQQFETEIFTNRGRRAQLRLTTVPYILDGQVAGVSGIAENITHQVHLQEQLSYQAFHDNLTGLPNRTLFTQRLNQALSTVERSRSQIAVLFVDLDNFNVVNDTLGHESGDEYLKIIASWLARCVGPSDTVARFGGDEFAVLLEYSRGDHDYPLRIAERISHDLVRPAVIQAHEINTGVSIGVAIYDRQKKDRNDLIREADIALGQAKQPGSGQPYQVYQDAMRHQIVERLEFERDLRRAIRNQEFVTFYQPIIEIRTGKIVNLEALVRWQHPSRGLLSPGQFLPIAEETGLITEIDELVMRMACNEIAGWNRANPGHPPITIGINLSARDFRRSDLVELITDILDTSGLDPSLLKFEITESTMMQDVNETFNTLTSLRTFGIGFSIDDFGTGYSSLAYLQRFPIDTLKIDRTFVDGLGGNGEDEIIVRTIITLAKSLQLTTIAEGLETQLQLDRARELECDMAQGYLISYPLPFDQIRPMLRGISPSVDATGGAE